jgi:hypothetical protein
MAGGRRDLLTPISDVPKPENSANTVGCELYEFQGTRDKQMKKVTTIVDQLADAAGVGAELEAELKRVILADVKKYQKLALMRSLPERPARDFDPFKETIIEYLQAHDGFGPWLKAGILSRPLIRKLQRSPKAYDGWTNWLRAKKPVPDDMQVLSKADLVSQEVEAHLGGGDPAERSREAAKLASRLHRQKKTG